MKWVKMTKMNRFEKILPNWLKSRVERERERNLAKKEEIVYKFDTIVSQLNHELFLKCVTCNTKLTFLE